MLKFIICFSALFFSTISIAIATPSGLEDPANPGGISSVNPTLTTQSQSGYVSSLSSTLCQLILIVNGRVGRAMAAIAIFGLGIAFFLGKITWTLITTLGIGLGTLFGAKSIALVLLPYAVTVTDPSSGAQVTATPDEIIRKVCPELI